MLNIYNDIWTKVNFQEQRRQTTVLPFPKPEKDNSDPWNYRPNPLTSCLCKISEKIINTRLFCYLEINKLMTDLPRDFRKKNRNVMSHVVWLESFIREEFIRKKPTCLLHSLSRPTLTTQSSNIGLCEISMITHWKLDYQNSLWTFWIN